MFFKTAILKSVRQQQRSMRLPSRQRLCFLLNLGWKQFGRRSMSSVWTTGLQHSLCSDASQRRSHRRAAKSTLKMSASLDGRYGWHKIRSIAVNGCDFCSAGEKSDTCILQYDVTRTLNLVAETKVDGGTRRHDNRRHHASGESVCLPRWPWCDRVDFRAYLTLRGPLRRCLREHPRPLVQSAQRQSRGVAELIVVARGR